MSNTVVPLPKSVVVEKSLETDRFFGWQIAVRYTSASDAEEHADE
jgi:hypothetical protein